MADLTVVKDSVYSFEIARRAVGRAALHLGIDSMTEQTLDVMADILLQYLSRTGKAMSILAESSRRTSAHVNVLDAFQACQLVASPAVGRLHLQEPEEEEDDMIATPSVKTTNGAGTEGSNGGSTTNAVGSPGASIPSNGGITQPSNVSTSSSSQSSTGWKGLAAFVFGPNWLQEKDEDEYLRELAAARNTDESNGEGRELSSGGAGGKVFPSSLENGDAGDGGISGEMGNRHRKKTRSKGWDAPYTDEVPAFPRASSTCANPHALPPRVTGVPSTAMTNDAATTYRKVDIDAEEAEEEEQDALNELEGLSDEVFLSYPQTIENDIAGVGNSTWGSIDSKRKRKPDSETDTSANKDEDGDVEMQSSPKKVKFEEGSAKVGSAKGIATSKKGSGGSSGGETKANGDGDSDEEEFLYIPNFYPRPPSMKVVVDDRRTVIDDMGDRQERLLQQQRTQEQQEQQVFALAAADEMLDEGSTSLRDNINIDSSRGIRSSLIRMGNTNYWGSGWDTASSTTSATLNLSVPMGRKVVDPSASGGAGGRAAPEDPIIPMSRASGSRVSRVLEGSMDTAAMQ